MSQPEPRCYMQPLVELLRDGRLEGPERASTEQHLAGCAQCQAAHRDLARLGDLLREGPAPPAGATALDHRRGRMRLLQAAALLDPSTERTTLAGLSAVAIPARVGRAMPAAAIALAALVVLGFAVVTMGDPQRVPAVTMGDPQRVPQTPPVLAAGATALDPPGSPAPDPAALASGADVPGVATSTALVPPEPPAPDPPVRPSAPRAPVAVGHPAPQPVVPAETAKPPEQAPPTFAAGVGSMEQGNFGEAIDRLGAFRRSHPHDLRSEDAAFLMIVALQRTGRHRDAVAAAREYLRQYPSGYRRKEAQGIVAHGD